MGGYVKLWSTILDSSVWREDGETCKVWISLLAMADRNGLVEASVVGIAHRAYVSIDIARSAIDKFLSPDLDSRTEDYSGARIIKTNGGFFVVNFEKYRDLIDAEKKSELNRLRQAKWRARNSSNALHNAGNACHTFGKKSNANADPDPDPDPDLIPPLISYSDHDLNHIHMPEQQTYDATARDETSVDPLPGLAVRIFDQDQDKKKTKRIDTSEDFEVFWEAYPEKKAKRKAWRAWMAAKPRLPDLPTILSAIDKQRLSGPWMAGYVPYPATWINGDRWLDENTAEKKQKLDPDEEWLNRKQIM